MRGHQILGQMHSPDAMEDQWLVDGPERMENNSASETAKRKHRARVVVALVIESAEIVKKQAAGVRKKAINHIDKLPRPRKNTRCH